MAQLAHISSQAGYGGYMKKYDKKRNYIEIHFPSFFSATSHQQGRRHVLSL